jgi:hypothetical protein
MSLTKHKASRRFARRNKNIRNHNHNLMLDEKNVIKGSIIFLLSAKLSLGKGSLGKELTKFKHNSLFIMLKKF